MAEIQPQQIEESGTRRASRLPNWRFVFHGVFWLLTSVAIVFTPQPFTVNAEYPIIGFLFGAIFGHTTGICIWASLGGGSHLFRGILALSYIFGLWLAVIFFWARQDVGSDIEFCLNFGAAIALQGFSIFGFCWLARITTGLTLISRETSANTPIQFQFRIKHIMILTFAVACLMAVSRGLILSLAELELDYEDIVIFLFLGMAAILITIPIAFACFLPHYFGLGLLVALLGCIAITAIEHSVYVSLIDLGGPDFYHMLFINLFSAGFVLVFSLGLRWCGYRLAIGRK